QAGADMLGVDLETYQDIARDYDAQFPEADALLKRAKRLAETRGYVKTLLGRRSRFPNGERTHKALNAVIQGTAADDHKLTLVRLYEERKRLAITMRLTVHDET